MNFSLSEDLQLMQRTIRDFAEQEIVPIAPELDRTHVYPFDTLKKMGELGLFGVMTPENYGGTGLGTLAFSVFLEEIAAADAAHATIMSVTSGLPQKLLLDYGTEEQKKSYVPKLATGEWIGAFCLSETHCGSDAAAMTTKAEKVPEGYKLNGTKAWVTSGSKAQLYLVLTKTDVNAGAAGVSCFVIEKGTEGMSFGKPEEKLGQHASTTTTITFEDCIIPETALVGQEGKGFSMAMASLDAGRIGIATVAIGISRAALEAATAYADERQAFGKSIRNFQGVGFKLADMATRIEASRLLTYKAAALYDEGKNVTKEASMAKLFASETSAFVTHQALQIFGGYGYVKDYPVERYFRDARITEIYEGTSEVQRLVISRELYKS